MEYVVLLFIIVCIILFEFPVQVLRINKEGIYNRRLLFIHETITWDLIDEVQLVMSKRGKDWRTYLRLIKGKSEFDINIHYRNKEKIKSQLYEHGYIRDVLIDDRRDERTSPLGALIDAVEERENRRS